jgi:hypothetical protein
MSSQTLLERVKQPHVVTRVPLALAAFLLFANGCMGLDFGDFGMGAPTDATTSGNVRVTAASLQGELGPAHALNHPATLIDARRSSEETAVTVTVDRPGSAAMTLLTVANTPSHVELREGETVTVYDSRRPSTSGRARLLGCAGPSVGVWHYDTYADNLVVLVERRRYARNVVTYHYMGDFTYYDSDLGRSRVTTVSGSFDLHLD